MIKIMCPNLECLHESLADPYIANFPHLMCMMCGTIHPNPYYVHDLKNDVIRVLSRSDIDVDAQNGIVVDGDLIPHEVVEEVIKDYLDGCCKVCFVEIPQGQLVCDDCHDDIISHQGGRS